MSHAHDAHFHANTYLQVVALPTRPAHHDTLLPAGLAVANWTDVSGREIEREVASWQRLDGLVSAGSLVRVHLQARQIRDLRLPLRDAVAAAVVTHDRNDRCEVAVGDLTDPSGWRFGVRMCGMRLTDC